MRGWNSKGERWKKELRVVIRCKKRKTARQHDYTRLISLLPETLLDSMTSGVLLVNCGMSFN
jgi:hypothetical protein